MRFITSMLLTAFLVVPLLGTSQHNYSVAGETSETPIYNLNPNIQYSILQMGYASSQIKDPELWNRKDKKITEIDLVFTAYPKNKKDWLTNYDWLLTKRIEAIQKLEPSLINNHSIKWNFILQTSCTSEEEAKRMFHGAVIKYISISTVKKISSIMPGQEQKTEIETINNTIESIAYGLSSFEDSVVYKTFNRNNWGKMLVVNDWTGSMYQYGAQAVLWHRMNFDKKLVKYFVFFNDGNEKIDRQKRIGNTGGIYYCKPDSIEHLLKVMKVIAKRGHGGDIVENNIEALLKGIKLFRGYDELVMIADNNAGVRDLILLEKIQRPVRIVLCGVIQNEPIHPHYLEIARRTGGSIHTVEEDITGLNEIKEGQLLHISGVDYVVKRGRIVPKSKKITHSTKMP